MAKKIKIEGDLYDRLAKYSEAAGYSSTDEFIVHVLDHNQERGRHGKRRR